MEVFSFQVRRGPCLGETPSTTLSFSLLMSNATRWKIDAWWWLSGGDWGQVRLENYSIFDVRGPLGKQQHLRVCLFGNSFSRVKMCCKEGSLCKRTPNDERPLGNAHCAAYIDKTFLLEKLLKATRWQNKPNYNRLVFIWHVGSKLMMLRTMCKLCKVELANIFQGWQTRPGIVWLGSLSVSVIPKSTKSFGWRKRFFRCQAWIKKVFIH